MMYTPTTGEITATNMLNINCNGIGINTTPATTGTAGSITAAGDITAFSDRRVKDNIFTLCNALSTVQALRGVSFTRTDTPYSTLRNIGVIAQEVEKVLPEVVRTSQDPQASKSVAYGNITAVLIEAVKELSAKVDRIMSTLNMT